MASSYWTVGYGLNEFDDCGSIEDVSPNPASQNDSLWVTITGDNTNFLTYQNSETISSNASSTFWTR